MKWSIYAPLQYDEMIRSSKTTGPLFEVRLEESQQILNFIEWWPKFFKRSTKACTVEL